MRELDIREQILLILYNGVAGYLPIFIVFSMIVLTTGDEPTNLTVLIFAIPSVIIGNIFRLGETIFDIKTLYK